jgi:hypothetical protein
MAELEPLQVTENQNTKRRDPAGTEGASEPIKRCFIGYRSEIL